MLWDVIKKGFEDELLKIAEMSLAGLSSETLLNYPQPKSMPSEAFAKAQAILQKAEQYSLPSEEKVAAPRPDVLPQLRRLTRRRDTDPPPTTLDKVTSYGGHTLAGAGAAKFVGDAVETGLSSYDRAHPGKLHFMQEKWTEGKLPARYKAAILASGAGLGLLHKIRKERRKKKWAEGHHH